MHGVGYNIFIVLYDNKSDALLVFVFIELPLFVVFLEASGQTRRRNRKG